MEAKLSDLALGNDFLDRISKAQAMKEKIHQLDYIKIKVQFFKRTYHQESEKYLQITYLMGDKYLEYIKNTL